MMLRIFALVIGIFLPALCSAADDVEALLNKAAEELARNGYSGDTSAAERYLHAVLERQPDHLEAQWQLIFMRFPSKNTPLSERSDALAAVGPAFARLAKQAKEKKKTGFLHYITATYASYYGAYRRALSEISKALALEPNSTRYLYRKGRLLVDYGSHTKQDAEVEKGINIIRKAQELAKTYPYRFVRDADYDFQIAWAVSQLQKPRWEEMAEHYRRFIEQSEESKESMSYAFAWNNVSIAYRQLGECDKAKEAAERALKVTKFGAAQWNKRFAEFCIEMQKMGLMTKKEAPPTSSSPASDRPS